VSKKDYIGPTIKQNKVVVLPEGPVAEFTTKANQGMQAARRLTGGEEPKVEGKMLQKPLQMGPPVNLPPKPGASAQDYDPRVGRLKEPLPTHLLGNTHIDSYQTLLANDRLEKPRIKAWQTDDKSIDKG